MSFYAAFAAESLQDEIERLRAQASLGWQEEQAHLVACGLRDGLTIAEVGCGPGLYAARLLTAFPGLTLCGVDHAPGLLRLVPAHAPGPSGSPLAVCASATALGLPTARFDMVIARFLFQHLANPHAAVREMRRILRPSGTLVVIDSDDALGVLFDPPIPALARVAVKVRLAQAFQGGDRTIGRRLPRILQAAGFAQVGFTSLLLHSDQLGLEGFRAAYRPESLLPFLHHGLLTSEEWEGANLGLDEFFRGPRPLVIEQRLIAWGTKPHKPDAHA